MSHTLKHATLVPASTPLGESAFAAARKVIEDSYGVKPDEVFLDVVRVDGTVQAGEFTLDLGQLGLRYLVFGADRPAEPAAAVAPTNLSSLLVDDDPLTDQLS